MKDKLQAYFDVARAQEPVMDKAELANLLGRTGVVVKKKRWFNLKIFITMITLSACTLAFWLLTHNSPVQPTTKTEQDNRIKDFTEKPAAKEVTTLSPHKTGYNKPFTTQDGPLKSKATDDPFNGSVLSDPDNEYMQHGETKTGGDYINADGYLVLSFEELAHLGIRTDGNVLQYANITGASAVEPGCNTCKETNPFYSIAVEKHGSRRETTTRTDDAALISSSASFWPSLIEVAEDNESQTTVVELLNGKGYDKEFARSVKHMLVPVWVTLKAKPGRRSHDLDLVFWFKKEEAFYNALPDEARTATLKKFGRADMQAYCDSLEKYRSIHLESGVIRGFDPVTVRSISNNVITLSDRKLKELGITRSNNGFVYSAHHNVEGQSKFLHIKTKGEYTVISNNKTIVRLGAFSAYTPVALTNEDLSHISYLKFCQGNDTESDHLLEEHFRENALNLVPIRVAPGSLLFFEKDSALKKLIGSPSLFGAQELMQLQKSYLKMTEEDFSKFNPFMPVAISDADITKVNYVSNNKLAQVHDDDAFMKEAHSLLGVCVGNSETVIWYEASEELNEVLALLHDEARPDLSLVKFLNLTVEEKKKLGITQNEKGTNIPSTITDRTTIYSTYNRSGSEHEFRMILPVGFTGEKPAKQVVLQSQDTLSFNKTYEMKPASKTNYPSPVLVTNSTGLVWYMYNLDTGDEIPLNKLQNEQFMKQKRNEDREKLIGLLGSFVPVKIDVEEQYKSNNKHIGLIAWYKPDSLFLNALHQDVASELKAELDALNNNKPAPTCKYFDGCGNHAGVIHKFNLYPNPVDDRFTIEVGLNEARSLNINIVDINGRLVKKLAENKQQDKGIIAYTYPAGNLAEGLYLLLVTTDKGERITQRLIKKQP